MIEAGFHNPQKKVEPRRGRVLHPSGRRAERVVVMRRRHSAAKKLAARQLIHTNNGDEYEGGEIVISDGYDHRGNHQFKVLPKLNAGDVIAWDGWTLHGINPVTSGVRYTLVIHFQGTLHS